MSSDTDDMDTCRVSHLDMDVAKFSCSHSENPGKKQKETPGERDMSTDSRGNPEPSQTNFFL